MSALEKAWLMCDLTRSQTVGQFRFREVGVHIVGDAYLRATDLLVLGLRALIAAAFAAWRFSWLPSAATA
jgi:hypothetical protein